MNLNVNYPPNVDLTDFYPQGLRECVAASFTPHQALGSLYDPDITLARSRCYPHSAGLDQLSGDAKAYGLVETHSNVLLATGDSTDFLLGVVADLLPGASVTDLATETIEGILYCGAPSRILTEPDEPPRRMDSNDQPLYGLSYKIAPMGLLTLQVAA